MSYYRPSQTVAMTRGRGFSSTYRGNSSGRSSWGGGDRGGRGGYGSSRGNSGGGRFSSFSNTLDSRSKYPPASTDRYSGVSTRSDYDDYHHKSYRSFQDMSGGGYSGREHRSPDRKRMRPEAPSSRRSHEGDSFNNSGSGRYPPNSFSDHRSFSRDRRPSFSSRRDDFRKPSGPLTGSPRGGYRGRISSRGMRGSRLRDGPPRRRLVESSYAIRRRVPPRISAEYSRRLKISRLRSAIARRTAIRRRQLSDKEDSEEKEKSDEETAVKKEKSGDTDVEEGGERKEEDESAKKSPKKETGTSDREDNKGAESDRGEEKTRRKEFIKLVCPHCNTKCITFSKYSMHLHSSRHIAAMRYVAMKQKSVLARMRLSQRNAQRELEKTAEDLAPRTNFCPLCKLNYKQPKATHQASEAHKSMKKFLMPYCRICRITFKSPMIYETHICSIEHIKRKSRSDVNGEKSDDKEDGSGNEEDNLENFMTIDSVGDVDDEEEGKKKEATTTTTTSSSKPKEPINVGIEQIRKIEVHYCELCRMYLPRVEESELERTLSRHCRQRTHMQRYIRYKEDKELTSRAERLQRKETAEKEREKNKVKDETKEPENENKPEEEPSKGEEKEKVNSGDDEENAEDKLWADDVNKDLGDLLAEAESGNKSSDEDEDSHADGERRYDRFGYSEKNGEDKKAAEGGEVKEEEGTDKPVETKVEDK